MKMPFPGFHVPIVLLAVLSPAIAGETPALPKRLREPVALAIVDEGKTLLAANRKSGSLSVVDLTTRRVVAEHDVGRGLSDLKPMPDGRHLLAVDRAANELLLIAAHDHVVGRIEVAADPARLVVLDGGESAVVASPASRRLTFVSLALKAPEDATPALALMGTLALPFAPGEMAIVPGGTSVVVADAYGGRIAVVDIRARSVVSVRSIPAHNIRGLAFAPDGQSLLVAHQYLNPLARTRFDDVHWGDLIRNHVRVIRTETLKTAKTDAALLDGGRLLDLGDVNYAAGDPGAIAFDNRGGMLVAIGGMDEIAIAAGIGQGSRRVVVGRRPCAIAVSPDGELAYVADALDDTISVVAIGTGQRPSTIALGPRPELSAAERGERLFFSAKLSHDGWMSCQSCHTDGQSNGRNVDTLGDGSYGAPKRVPSLLGVAATGPWTWTGSIGRLEDQVRKSIATTMHGTKPTDAQVADLTAYLASLPALVSARGAEAPAVARGRAVFQARKCAGCHEPPEYTTPKTYDVGLADQVGNRLFNPPSLRNVGRRDAWLHDGRAHALRDVFAREHHPRGLTLSPAEVDDLAAFLETL